MINAREQSNVIVEVGPGRLPFWVRDGSRRLRQTDHYIGVDGFGQRRIGQDVLSRLTIRSYPGMAEFIDNATGGLPLPGDSADEVVLINVFGDRVGANATMVDPGARGQLMSEVSRIVRPREIGLVTVVETLTPEQAPLEALVAEMGAHNLRRTNVGHEYSAQYIEHYAGSGQSRVHEQGARRPYVAVFRSPRGL